MIKQLIWSMVLIISLLAVFQNTSAATSQGVEVSEREIVVAASSARHTAKVCYYDPVLNLKVDSLSNISDDMDKVLAGIEIADKDKIYEAIKDNVREIFFAMDMETKIQVCTQLIRNYEILVLKRNKRG